MAFNVSNFSSQVRKYGLSRDNLFVLRITPPILDGVEMPVQDLIFFCKSVDLPALNINTVDFKSNGWGRSEKMPSGMNFDELQAIFMIDAGFKVKAFFHRWLQSVVNFDSSKPNGSFQGARPFEMAYKQDYIGTIEVVVYSFNDESVNYVYRFFNAYPVSMGNITTSWENNDGIMTVPISFAFDGYTSDGVGVSGNYEGAEEGFPSLNNSVGNALGDIVGGNSLTNTINRFSTAINTFNSIF